MHWKIVQINYSCLLLKQLVQGTKSLNILSCKVWLSTCDYISDDYTQ